MKQRYKATHYWSTEGLGDEFRYAIQCNLKCYNEVQTVYLRYGHSVPHTITDATKAVFSLYPTSEPLEERLRRKQDTNYLATFRPFKKKTP